MVSTTTPQVPTGSLDTAGISISTATRTAENVRAGTIYNPITLAAAQPLWFHPMSDGRYLMVNSRTWTAATPAGGIGYYSGYTESVAPSWVIVDGPSGAVSQVPNYPLIPFKNLVTSATVMAAASRPPGYLFLLHQALLNGNVQAILQIVSVATNGAVTLVGEEVLPTVQIDSDTSVLFDAGLQFTDPYLMVYGRDTDNTVYTIRKPWSKVGTTRQTNPSPQSHAGVGATEVEWSYYTGTGYSPDSTQLAPVTTVLATSLTTTGPMSFALVGTQWISSTVSVSGSTVTAHLWSSRAGRPLTALGSPVPLGSTSSGTYLGGGLQLQPQLSVATVPSGAKTALLYVISTKLTASDNHALVDTWGTIPINV
jgi:hypothetical protein